MRWCDKVEYDWSPEIPNQWRRELKDFLDFLIEQEPNVIDVLDGLLVKVRKSHRRTNTGRYRNLTRHGVYRSERVSNGIAGDVISLTLTKDTRESKWESRENWMGALAHEFKHFAQTYDGGEYHEGEAELWAERIIQKYREAKE